MPYEIRRPGDQPRVKPRLSALGRRVVAVALLLALVIAGVAYARTQAANRREELAQQVVAAVERSAVVCANALAAVKAPVGTVAELQSFLSRLEDSSDVIAKAEVAQEMITWCLPYAEGSPAQVDELHGARNRILLAVERYNAAR